ncbi:MAG: DUF3365 domain-containing protein, partial [Pseudomonadota bacterium]
MSHAACAQDQTALEAEGAAIIRSYATALTSELSAAIQAGGPAGAIDICNLRAPLIAAQFEDASGWSVAR